MIWQYKIVIDTQLEIVLLRMSIDLLHTMVRTDFAGPLEAPGSRRLLERVISHGFTPISRYFPDYNLVH